MNDPENFEEEVPCWGKILDILIGVKDFIMDSFIKDYNWERSNSKYRNNA